jgi:hypothetical protein
MMGWCCINGLNIQVKVNASYDDSLLKWNDVFSMGTNGLLKSINMDWSFD